MHSTWWKITLGINCICVKRFLCIHLCLFVCFCKDFLWSTLCILLWQLFKQLFKIMFKHVNRKKYMSVNACGTLREHEKWLTCPMKINCNPEKKLLFWCQLMKKGKNGVVTLNRWVLGSLLKEFDQEPEFVEDFSC